MTISYVNGLYRNDTDLTFVNTQYFREAAMHFLKHGCYTFATGREFTQYWDIQEDRCKNGYSVGGLSITGEHYGYLNFAQIKVTQDDNKHNYKEALKIGHTKSKRISAEKKVTFPDFYDGDYHYFKAKEFAREQGLHLCVGKARRKGYSYKNGWIGANRYNFHPQSITVIGAFDSRYLYPRGTMSMVREYLDYINKHTDWTKRRLLNNQSHIKSGFKMVGKDEEYGYLSEVIAVSFGPANPGAARGKDGTLFMFEEAGKFPNLIESLTSTAPAVEDGIYVTGQILIFGTGGDDASNWDGFEEIFYNPESYNMLAFENIWDENAEETSCGFFIPQVMNLPGFIDKDGNSKIKEATEHELAIREDIKKNSKTSTKLSGYQMEYPLKPSEAFARNTNNIFPTIELDAQLKLIQRDANITHLGRQGLYKDTTKGVVLQQDDVDNNEYKYIKEFPLKKSSDTDVSGCIIEWQPPFTTHDGKIPKGLYRIWHDPYAQDKNTDAITIRDSLGATYVYEMTNAFTPTRGDILVAAYVGRPASMDAYNKQLYLLAKRYGASTGMLQFENDRGDVKNFFKKMKAYHLLADEPEVTWKRELQSAKTGRIKGILMNTKRKGTSAIYLRDWLLTKRGIDVNGNDVLNLNYIYDEGLLKELLKWSLSGNFDRVSAMLVGMFDYREVETQEEIKLTSENTHDDFFNREFFNN